MKTLSLFVWTFRDVIDAIMLGIVALFLAAVGICALWEKWTNRRCK